MHAPWFLRPWVTVGLLIFAGGLTAEEGLYLVLSHPAASPARSFSHHDDCRNLDTTGLLIDCPSRGYGRTVLFCTHYGCYGKEPTTGLRFSPSELYLLRGPGDRPTTATTSTRTETRP